MRAPVRLTQVPLRKVQVLNTAVQREEHLDVCDDDLFDKMVVVPKRFLERPKPPPPLCWWCTEEVTTGERFMLRDGPVDYHFCCEAHALAWMTNRYEPATAGLCRLCPAERRSTLESLGLSMDLAINALLLADSAKESHLKNT